MKKRVSFFFVVSVVFFLTACKIESQNNAVIEWAKYIDDTHIEIYGKGEWGNILPKIDIGIYEKKDSFTEFEVRHKIVDYKYKSHRVNHLICEIKPSLYSGETIIIIGFGGIAEGGVIGNYEILVPWN